MRKEKQTHCGTKIVMAIIAIVVTTFGTLDTRGSVSALCSETTFWTGNDSNAVDGSDIIIDDDDIYASLSSPTRRDTLRTYTLNGVCIKGAAKSQPTRTLYNIIIKNGRKVLKR